MRQHDSRSARSVHEGPRRRNRLSCAEQELQRPSQPWCGSAGTYCGTPAMARHDRHPAGHGPRASSHGPRRRGRLPAPSTARKPAAEARLRPAATAGAPLSRPQPLTTPRASVHNRSWLCLDVTGDSTGDGADLELRVCNGGSDQRRRLGQAQHRSHFSALGAVRVPLPGRCDDTAGEPRLQRRPHQATRTLFLKESV